MATLRPVPHYIIYYNFVVSFEMGKYESSNVFSFGLDYFGCSMTELSQVVLFLFDIFVIFAAVVLCVAFFIHSCKSLFGKNYHIYMKLLLIGKIH